FRRVLFRSYDEHVACIVVRSSWWTSRRSLTLEVHLAVTPPGRDVAKLPPLPEATQRLLDALPSKRRERQHLLPDASESAARHSAEPAAAELVKSVNLREVELPHPELADDEWHAQGEAFGSFKEQLCALLPRWRYRGDLTRRG